MKKALIALVILAAGIGLATYFYFDYKRTQEMRYPKFYSGNGRLEATEVYISNRLSGRIDKIFVKEGSLVKTGDTLVKMDTRTLEAEKASAVAEVKVKEGELEMAKADLKKQESSFVGAQKEYNRQKTLLATSAVSQKTFDDAETVYLNAVATLEHAKAALLAAEGKLARQKAEVVRIQTLLDDSTLTARYDGRIQYLLAHEGEVVSDGGRIMNEVNLTDAYMTFFLPTAIAGQVTMGAEVKLMFDAGPGYHIDAKVTYIDPVAQFTPKSVETKVEREKLMFRIKAHVNAELLRKYIDDVKTGLPGVAWVKLDPKADWKDAPVNLGKNSADEAN